MRFFFKKYKLTILIVAVTIFSSCEKVINLKVGKTEPKIVIEGIVTDLNVKHLVSLSLTKDLDMNNDKVPVSDAIVVLKEEGGPTISFTEQAKTGNYYSPKFKGTPGKKYTISITANGKTYTASSLMPYPVAIDSLSQIELTFFGEKRKLVQVHYKDPADEENYYSNKLFVNGLTRGNLFIESDRFNNGKNVKNTIFVDDSNLETGDKVRFQLLTLDKNVYRYLFSIGQITGSSGPPTAPANPISNFNNDALGYFSASTLSTDSLVIK